MSAPDKLAKKQKQEVIASVNWQRGHKDKAKRAIYRRNDYIKHKDARDEYSKNWRKQNRDKNCGYIRKYKHRTMIYSSEYAGVCVCPLCGKKGYKDYKIQENTETKSIIVNTQIRHRHRENGKLISDGSCFLGKGRL